MAADSAPGYGFPKGDFPFLEPPSTTDMDIIRMQLGRPPAGEVMVAFRCPRGVPAVIFTRPARATGDRVPPLLWLSCPFASREVSRLESEGFIGLFAERLQGDSTAMELFLEDERLFARAFTAAAEGEGFLRGRSRRGVAGGVPGRVKCLHAQLAFRLASGEEDPPQRGHPRGLVGGWCLEELDKREGLWCGRTPETCLR